MSKNSFGKFIVAAAAVASACAGAYYFFSKKTAEKAADTDAEAFDDAQSSESRNYVDLDLAGKEECPYEETSEACECECECECTCESEEAVEEATCECEEAALEPTCSCEEACESTEETEDFFDDEEE